MRKTAPAALSTIVDYQCTLSYCAAARSRSGLPCVPPLGEASQRSEASPPLSAIAPSQPARINFKSGDCGNGCAWVGYCEVDVDARRCREHGPDGWKVGEDHPGAY